MTLRRLLASRRSRPSSFPGRAVRLPRTNCGGKNDDDQAAHGLIEPTSGSGRSAATTSRRNRSRRSVGIGYIPDVAEFYDKSSRRWEFMAFIAELFQVPHEGREDADAGADGAVFPWCPTTASVESIKSQPRDAPAARLRLGLPPRARGRDCRRTMVGLDRKNARS